MFGRTLVGRIPRTIAVWGRRSTLPPNRPLSSDEHETGQSTHLPAVVPAFFPYIVHSLEAAIAFQFANEGFVPAVRTAADQPPVDLSRVFFAPTWKVLRRDLNGLKLLASLKWRMRRAFRRNQPLHFYFNYWVYTTPNKECVIEVETGRSFTFKELNELSNKYANYFRERGLQRGDVVALFMENSADFFALWLGLSKLGVVTAWINTHLKQELLAHSLHTAHTHTIVTTSQLLPSLLTTIDEGLLPKDTTEIITVGPNNHSFPDLTVEAQDTSEPPIPKGLNFESTLCYIYTSGTTGNPKAAIVKHFRYHFMTLASGSAFGIRGTDRIYISEKRCLIIRK
ncbi:hypothetical protein M3Y99_01409500 [Aphelenchoides fujianensis]|nr:hypothetical protein M3Y99_01409500 [Aphelenchoides fujianensis]